ncbi:glycoside hydrolase [Achaetomium macrosporum]|uniref:alpha-1,2-Mannosidase n=1 Tax=Achaetomium macrosporum TaxID=79813 RepID=A0AAN7H6M7_9PEZI|nr:glycoside hydrolase [Achaetomium macrosporum]
MLLRLRRYRVLLVCAFVITVLLYHVAKNSSQWDHPQEIWHGTTHPNTHPKPRPPPPPPPGHDDDHEHEHKPEHHSDKGPPPPPHPPPPPPRLDEEYQEEPRIRLPELKTSDGVKGGYSLPTKAPLPLNPADTDEESIKAAPSVPDRKPPSNHDEYGKQDEETGIQLADPPAKFQGEDAPTLTTTIHWEKPSEWFPVPLESIIALPTGKPKPMPSVQFAFGEESPAAKEKRERRLAKVKAEAQRAWSGYKEYAWTHDELKPVSKKTNDPFCGWAATLVDSLDTLWIMGLEDEFDDAVEAVKDIDFTTTPYRDQIPVFETVIRYLGGLLGAYDVSGGHKGKYRVLLDKAVELAEILMGVFDTPNRMPILYYNWKPAFNVNPKRASKSAGVAELGSLSMEFTRLAQLTGENKYYDAVARITDALEDLQNRENATAIPGIFPEHLDASGCNRSAPLPPSTLENSSEAAQKQTSDGDDSDLRRAPGGYPSDAGADDDKDDQATDARAGSNTGLQKRRPPPNPAPTPLNAKGLPADWDCVPQGLTAGGYGGGSYSMGGSQDSAYEYFPKQYVLLGGLEAKYRTMHEKVADAVKQYLLFRPMAEGDPDILFSAKAYSSDGTVEKMTYEWEVTHLTCFLGGMFGLGGKLFDRPEDVEIGKKLADGCVWAYEVMPTGIMPEYAMVLPCKSPDDCHYDQAAWYDALDPNRDYREKQLEEYPAKHAEWEQKVEELKKKDVLRKQQAEERERQAAAEKKAAEDEERRRRLTPLTLPSEPQKPLTHLEFVTKRIQEEHIPSGFVSLNDKRYILRPEAIESVWYMYRITGDPAWQDKGWRMFEAVVAATRTEVAHSAIRDVAATESTGSSKKDPTKGPFQDSMESFWLAETLKYFYLLFEKPDVISLDEWVLNTEAHPFRRPM